MNHLKRTLRRLENYQKIEEALRQTKKETGIDPNPYLLGLAGLVGMFFSQAAKKPEDQDLLEDVSNYLVLRATTLIATDEAIIKMAKEVKKTAGFTEDEVTKGTKGTTDR